MARKARVTHAGAAQPEIRIGARLRSARQSRGLTLAQVAVAAGLSTGYVSRLERDDVSPSVASLVTVCEVLGLRVGDLFEPPATAVVRAGQGREIAFGGTGAHERLISAGEQQNLEVIHSVVEAGGNGGAELYTLDCDTECVHVVGGRLVVVLEGEELDLGPGDTLTFSGRVPHTWRNDSAAEATVLWMLAPVP